MQEQFGYKTGLNLTKDEKMKLRQNREGELTNPLTNALSIGETIHKKSSWGLKRTK